MDQFNDIHHKEAEGAAVIALLPGCAPLAYIYIGGWRYGLVSLPIIYLAAYVCAVVSDSAGRSGFAAILVGAAWKVFAAAKLRNTFVDVGSPGSVQEFESFRFAGFAMVDLVLGACMALAAGWIFRGLVPPDFFMEGFIRYGILAFGAVWLVELALGSVLVRASEACFGAVNPFLEDRRQRWKRNDRLASVEAYTVAKSIPIFLPTPREAIHAALLVVAVPLAMAASSF